MSEGDAEDVRPVGFVIDGRVARITLQEATQAQRLNDEVRLAIKAALDELEERPDVSVLVLTGAGRAFSAGADLTLDLLSADRGRLGDPTPPHRDVAAPPRPARAGSQATVAGLHGHVVGGAALLAAARPPHRRRRHVLRIPELALGIPLTWAGIPLLVREVGLPATATG